MSTLAFHTAYSLGRTEGKRVLLMDLDLTCGVIGFYSKLNHPYSVVDALQSRAEWSAADWSAWVVPSGGIDVLPAPPVPYCGPVEAGSLAALFDYARANY